MDTILAGMQDLEDFDQVSVGIIASKTACSNTMSKINDEMLSVSASAKANLEVPACIRDTTAEIEYAGIQPEEDATAQDHIIQNGESVESGNDESGE